MVNAPLSGGTTTELLANYDPDSQSWRTCQTSLTEASTEFAARWPKSGMTRSGTLYPLPTWVRPTSAKESGLWPTPTVQDSENDAGPSQWKRNSYPLNVEVHRADGRTATTKTGQLNPQFVEYLMGYPIGWTDLED